MSIFKRHSNFFLKHITIALIIALAAIGITSCSTDDDSIVNLPNESAAVLFHTVVDKDIQTRGASMDNDALKSESFGVLAYYTQNSAWTAASASATPNFMYNQKVAWSTTNTTWNYSPMKYWPNNTNDKVSFFAYAPYEETPATGANKGIKLSSNTTNDTPAIDFTVNSNITNQVDLVYASAKDKNKELVDFQFKHALSRIGFSAKAASDYGNTKIKVKSVSIKGKFYPTATFTFSNLSNDGSWSNFGTPAATGITYAPELNVNANALGTVAQQISKDNQYIMVIPQNFEGANKLTVVTNYTSVTNGVESPDTKTKSEDINLNFEQGKAYNIVLNISLEQVITPQPEANSYIVAPNGAALKIPVVRANQSMIGNQLVAGNAFTAELVWTDNSSSIKSISVEGTGPTGFLVVEPGTAEGNAVVAIKFGGKILWSWHIWVTAYAPTSTVPTNTFMDRNLGAIGNTPGAVNTKGMLYQWGRKDPFTRGTTNIIITEVSSSAGLSLSVENPTTFYYSTKNLKDWYTHTGSSNHQNDNLWNSTTNTKTVYDPCPPGWRVPLIGVWSGLTTSNFQWSVTNKGRTNNSFGGFYPAAGSRSYANGGLVYDGSQGYYWSASVNWSDASCLSFNDGNVGTSVSSQSVAGRANGHSVRCVKE